MKLTTYEVSLDPEEIAYSIDRYKALDDLASFRKWARINSDILRWLYSRACYLAAHRRRDSMMHLFQQMRWDSGIRISGYDADVKLKNSYAPLVARILIKSLPPFADCVTVNKSYFDTLTADELPTLTESGRLVWSVDE